MGARGPLAALLGANALSACGTAMTVLAVPWFVLQTTGSAARTGLVAGVEVFGAVVGALAAGPVVDRVGRRAASVASDLLAAAVVAAIPLLHGTSGLPFALLVPLAWALGLVAAPGATARRAMVPALTARAEVSTERASGAYEGVWRGARMLGGPLAGVLIALLGPPGVLLVDAATFLGSALLVRLFVPAVGGKAPGGYGHRLRGGLAYLRRDRALRWVVLLVSGTNLLDAAFFAVLLPVYAERVLGSSVALGAIAGVWAGGGLAGSLAYAWLGARLSRRWTLATAFLVSGAPRFALLAAAPPLPMALAALAVFGCAVGTINPVLGVVQFDRVPDDVRPVVGGVLQAGSQWPMPVGAVLAGFAVDGFGLVPTLLTASGVYLAITLWPALAKGWREMDEEPVGARH
ncbi:MFS transporter [Actinokineospora auranticolor]|nr:MFS transporter [Actinokineospora auranticolor]